MTTISADHSGARRQRDAAWQNQDLYATFSTPPADDDEPHVQAILRRLRTLARSLTVRAAMRGAVERDCGIFDYQKNWGFTPTPLQYAYKLINAAALLDNHALNLSYRRFIAMWKKTAAPGGPFPQSVSGAQPGIAST